MLLAEVAKGDILQVIVADDLFQLCVRPEDPAAPGPESLLLRAVYRAARAWAGQEEVARGRLVAFLRDACPGARAFMPVRLPAGLPALPYCPAACCMSCCRAAQLYISCLHALYALSPALDG